LQERLDSSHVRVANGFGLELRHEQLWIEGFDRVFAFWVSLETLGRDHMSGEHLGSKIGMASSRVETRTFFWPVASVFRRIFFRLKSDVRGGSHFSNENPYREGHPMSYPG
jgi:hypothetical protein